MKKSDKLEGLKKEFGTAKKQFYNEDYFLTIIAARGPSPYWDSDDTENNIRATKQRKEEVQKKIERIQEKVKKICGKIPEKFSF